MPKNKSAKTELKPINN